MSSAVDPNLKKAEILVKYAQTRDAALKDEVLRIVEENSANPLKSVSLENGPFQFVEQAERSIVEAGKAVAGLKLAGNVFGNISTILDDVIYISSTGSELCSLENSITYCDVKGNVLNGLNPSSELPSHLKIFNETSSKCILHAHPFFTVVYAMMKGINKTMFGVPIVGGNVGGGKGSIAYTVPPVLKDFNIVTVHSHGVFAVDAFDFNAPIKNIIKLETLCQKKYIREYL